MNEIILRNLVVLCVEPGKAYKTKEGVDKYSYAKVTVQNDCTSTLVCGIDDRKFHLPFMGEEVSVCVKCFTYNGVARFSINVLNLSEKIS